MGKAGRSGGFRPLTRGAQGRFTGLAEDRWALLREEWLAMLVDDTMIVKLDDTTPNALWVAVSKTRSRHKDRNWLVVSRKGMTKAYVIRVR